MRASHLTVVAGCMLAVGHGCVEGDLPLLPSPSATGGGGGVGGIGGALGGGALGGGASEGGAPSTPECYREQDIVYLSGDHQIVGHRDLCSADQLAAIADCWQSGDIDCPTFFTNAANAECGACLRGTTSSAVIPVLMWASGLDAYYVEVVACEAVASELEQCIDAVSLELCRVSACETCYGEMDKYQACLSFAGQYGCPAIELTGDCATMFFGPIPTECDGPSAPSRAIQAAQLLCGK